MRRRQPPEPETPRGVPVDLAAGPSTATWGAHLDDLFGAWRAWQDARDTWARAHGLDPVADYRHLPPELFDRKSYRPKGTTPHEHR